MSGLGESFEAIFTATTSDYDPVVEDIFEAFVNADDVMPAEFNPKSSEEFRAELFALTELYPIIHSTADNHLPVEPDTLPRGAIERLYNLQKD